MLAQNGIVWYAGIAQDAGEVLPSVATRKTGVPSLLLILGTIGALVVLVVLDRKRIRATFGE